MTMHLADAFDLIAHTELLEQRLAAAVALVSEDSDLAEEMSWLEAARRRVERAREGIGDLLTRAVRHPELAAMRGERARALQGAAVDAVERLQSAMAAAAGERSPLLEVLSRNLKPPAMRRANRDDFEKFCSEIDKRLGSTYAKRMLADPTYAVVEPQLSELRRAFADWRTVLTNLTPSDAQSLRDELETTARRLELPCRQARLLAEAALLAAEDLKDSSGIFEKPKRRAARVVRTELDADTETSKTPPPAEASADAEREAR